MCVCVSAKTAYELNAANNAPNAKHNLVPSSVGPRSPGVLACSGSWLPSCSCRYSSRSTLRSTQVASTNPYGPSTCSWPYLPSQTKTKSYSYTDSKRTNKTGSHHIRSPILLIKLRENLLIVSCCCPHLYNYSTFRLYRGKSTWLQSLNSLGGPRLYCSTARSEAGRAVGRRCVEGLSRGTPGSSASFTTRSSTALECRARVGALRVGHSTRPEWSTSQRSTSISRSCVDSTASSTIPANLTS